MTATEVKLQQIDQQISVPNRHQSGQQELFLVINRLEDFAAAVNDRLDTIDFDTKREIIRALIKRIEEWTKLHRHLPGPGSIRGLNIGVRGLDGNK